MILIGAALDHWPGPKYAAQLPFAQLTLRAPLPRASTLKRQRHEAPEGLMVSLRAPRSCLSSKQGPLRFDPALEESFAWLLAAADAIDARAVLLPTPADLTPGMRDIELLRAFAARLPRSETRHWVWQPAGPWEPERAEALATELGLVLAFDPLMEQRPIGSVAYACLNALGARHSFSQAALEQALERVVSPDVTEAFIAIDAPRAVAHAVALQQVVVASSA